MRGTTTTLDERDQTILAARIAARDARTGPRVGDYVRFADDIIRRISHIWSWDDGTPAEWSVQTSDGGSYYLGDGYVSMSGGLYPGIPYTLLEATDETAEGSAWFFSHDYHTAHNGVDVTIPCRVFTVAMAANR